MRKLTDLRLVNIDKLSGCHAEVELLLICYKNLIWTDIGYHYLLKGIVYLLEITETVDKRIDLKLINAFGLI